MARAMNNPWAPVVIGVVAATGLALPVMADVETHIEIAVVGDDGAGSHILAGTLLFPEGDGPFAVVVLLTGSGPQDRDETVAGHKPFKVLAEALAAAGVATLRCDDRGTGESTGDYASTMSEDFAADAVAQVNWLAAREDIDRESIGVLGHSQGGVAAAIVAAGENEIDFVIFSGSPGVDGATVMASQAGAMLRGMGRSDENAAESERLRREILTGVIAGAEKSEVEPLLRELILNDAQVELPEETMVMAVGQAWAQFSNPQIVGFVRDDPRPFMEKISVPVLIVNGGMDFQVIPEVNVPGIQGALSKAGNTRVTTLVLESHNHLLQLCETGMLDEYAKIGHAMSPEALGEIVGWVVETIVID